MVNLFRWLSTILRTGDTSNKDDFSKPPKSNPPTDKSVRKRTDPSKKDEDRYAKRFEGEREQFERRYKLKCRETKLDNYRLEGVVPPGWSFFKNPIMYVVRHKEKLDRHALKVFSKEKGTEKFERERALLFAHKCDFIIELNYVIETPHSLCSLLDFMERGSLKRTLRLPEQTTKICAAQVILAIEYLHECGIIYRNLELDHVLICDDYFVRISNLTNAKKVTERTNTFLGAIGIMPPEVHKGCEYGKAVDWWSFGIFLYEALYGTNPFCEPFWDTAKQIDAVLKPELTFSELYVRVSSEAREIISSLLRSNPDERLGALRGGAEDIKRHVWFNDISFVDVFNKKIAVRKIDIEPMSLSPVPALIGDEL